MLTLIYERADPISLRRTRVVRDAETGLPLIVSSQAVQRIADDAKRYAGIYDKHVARRRGGRMVAMVPAVIVEHLMKMGIWQDPKAKLEWLSRRDAQAFRTDGGGPLV